MQICIEEEVMKRLDGKPHVKPGTPKPLCPCGRPVKRHDATYCSYACRPKPPSGEENYNWGGADISYMGFHKRVYRARGKASDYTCECGAPAKDWANLTGNYPDPSDFKALCRSCHRQLDGAVRGDHSRQPRDASGRFVPS